jgi:hypothetical protein
VKPPRPFHRANGERKDTFELDATELRLLIEQRLRDRAGLAMELAWADRDVAHLQTRLQKLPSAT